MDRTSDALGTLEPFPAHKPARLLHLMRGCQQRCRRLMIVAGWRGPFSLRAPSRSDSASLTRGLLAAPVGLAGLYPYQDRRGTLAQYALRAWRVLPAPVTYSR